jgi:hypothetical protein
MCGAEFSLATTIRTTGQIEAIAACGRKAIYNALDALESTGLIQINWAPGRRHNSSASRSTNPYGYCRCADEPRGLTMVAEEQALTHRLRTHVDHLAGEIGERNVFRPTALQAGRHTSSMNGNSKATPLGGLPMTSREFLA